MHNIGIRRLVYLLIVLLFSASPLSFADTQKNADETQIATRRVLNEMRKLLHAPPVKTDEVIDGLLSSFETTFENSKQEVAIGDRTGQTKGGAPINLQWRIYPDGFRQIYLSLGVLHILTFDDIEGRLVNASMTWIENPTTPGSRKLHLFRDSAARQQSLVAWNNYRQKISRKHPELPQFRLPESFRTSWVPLYDSHVGGVFGTFCGYAGIAPDGRVSMVRLLNRRQVTPIRYILRSPSAVSKLYAAEALLIWHKAGHAPERSDRILIDQLRGSSLRVETCFRGVYQEMTVGEAFGEFTSQSLAKYLARFRELGYLK